MRPVQLDRAKQSSRLQMMVRVIHELFRCHIKELLHAVDTSTRHKCTGHGMIASCRSVAAPPPNHLPHLPLSSCILLFVPRVNISSPCRMCRVACSSQVEGIAACRIHSICHIISPIPDTAQDGFWQLIGFLSTDQSSWT